MNFVIHNTSNSDTTRMLEIIHSQGGANVEILTDTVFDDIIKRDKVNKYISNMPNDTWLVNPDSDEFFFSSSCRTLKSAKKNH